MKVERIEASFSQKQLWFLENTFQLGHLYYVPLACEILDKIDAEALEVALHKITERHEVLRTAVALRDGVPFQLITTELRPVLEHTFSERTLINRQAEIFFKRPFSLVDAPLWRARFIECEKSSILLFCFHHIIFDHFSADIFLRDLSEFYHATLENRAPSLPPLAVQYADYALWQQSLLSSAVFETKLTKFCEQLAPYPMQFHLPLDRRRPMERSYRGAVEFLPVSAEMHTALKSFCVTKGLTAYQFILAAFFILLNRITQSDRLLIGTPVTGRQKKDFESLIGFFVNMLPVPADLSENPTVAVFLENIKFTVLDLFDYSDIPFECLVAHLHAERSVNNNPIFQVMFLYQTLSNGETHWMGKSMQPLTFSREVSRFDLSLFARETISGLELGFEYDTDIFEKNTVKCWLNQLFTLIQNMLRFPSIRLSSLESLPDPERELLFSFNNRSADYPVDIPVHILFTKQALSTPHAAVVQFENHILNYLQLDQLSNQWAHYLIERGVSNRDFVALEMERSIELIIAILAVLKVGAAYVPIDPRFPEARRQLILEDCKPAYIICNAELENIKKSIKFLSTAAPIVSVNSKDPIYVIYTSGSTGVPKGVVNRHESLVNRLFWMQQEYDIEVGHRILHKTPYTFDVSVWELLLPILVGATLVIAPPDSHLDPIHLARLIQQQDIQIIHFVPSMLDAFLQAGVASDCISLKQVFTSGEALSLTTQNAFFNAFGTSVKLHNLYGPTEAAIDVTHWTCDPNYSDTCLPIGRPISNMQIWILNEEGLLSPIGIPGELCIGGIGVASGYLNKPEQTQKQFVKNRVASDSEYSLYKTGDLARFLPDGAIEYLGRLDNQIKLRGLRIELGDIEASLVDSNLLLSAVVRHWKKESSEYLVAYVVPRNENKNDPELKEQLENFLRKQIPLYMIPNLYVILEALPLSANGKIDRKQLPDPQFEVHHGVKEVAPRNPDQAKMLALWKGLLPIKEFGVEQSFFELGGHSLLSIRLVAKIREQFKVDISLKSIFEFPTIVKLCDYIQKLTRESILFDCRKFLISAPLSFAQQRLWFIESLLPGTALYHVPLVFRCLGKCDIPALTNAVAACIKKYPVLRSVFEETFAGVIQKWSAEVAPMHFIEEPRFSTEKNALQAWILDEINRPFDFSNGPLFRAACIKISADEHWLVLTAHHLVIDAWSYDLLCSDISNFYEAFLHGKPTEDMQSEMPVHYGHYAKWQRQMEDSLQMQAQKNYWVNHLKNVNTTLPLSPDFERPAQLSYRGGKIIFQLSSEILKALKAHAQKQECSLFMLLMTLYQLLLFKQSGQAEIVVGTPIANRQFLDFQNIMGYFVNMLPIVGKFESNQKISDLLQEFRKTILDAFNNQDISFDQLVNSLSLDRNINRNPVFQTLFVFQNSEKPPLSLVNMAVESVDTGRQFSKFDIALTVSEKEGLLECQFDFMLDLFSPESVKILSEHFIELCRACAEDLSLSLGEMNLLSAKEYLKILEFGQGPRVAYPEITIQELFELTAKQHPNRVAVQDETKTLSYQSFDELTNQWSFFIDSLGISAGSWIAVSLERGCDLAMIILAILKAGCAYVPLVPDLPEDRLNLILSDSQISLLIDQNFINDHESQVKRFSHQKRAVKYSAADVAYVIYTSGSTGVPKGVENTQRGVVNRLLWMQRRYGVTKEDLVLQKTSYGFDVSVWEFFLPLISGATLVMAPPGAHQDPAELMRCLQNYSITLVHFVPTMLEAFLAYIEADFSHSLRAVFVSGEALPVATARRFFERFQCELHNLYGPTEAAIDVTEYAVIPENLQQISIPIGRPIDNVTVHILDEHLKPVAIGIVGELYLGGVALARGYANRPDLTAQRFIIDPFEGMGGRLYKTGDWVRWSSLGQIEFMGRIDSQVKIKGFRIELGEIESHLLSQPEVQSAVVLVREDEIKQKYLIAYVVGPSAESENILKTTLMKVLPAYMVPQRIIILESMPLLSSGKVNRHELPVPVSSTEMHAGVNLESTFENKIEEVLAKLYSQLLGGKNIKRDSHFFELGGDSILSMSLVTKARAQGLHLSVKDIFNAPTVKELATLAKPIQQAITTYHSEERFSGEGILTPIQKWFFESAFRECNYFNQSRLWQSNSKISVDEVEAALKTLLQRHSILRTRFTRTGQIIYQEYIDLIPCVVSMDVGTESHAEKIRRVACEAQKSLDIVNGPLFKLIIMNGESHQYLFFVIHHLLVDAVSWKIILNELNQTLHSVSSPFIGHPPCYQSWAAAIERKAHAIETRRDIPYWEKILSKTTGRLKQNTHAVKPEPQRFEVSINPKVTETLFEKSFTQHKLTLNEILVSALVMGFSTTTGRYDLLFQMESHGREVSDVSIDTTQMVGWFTALFPVYINLSDSTEDFGKIFREVKLSLRAIPENGATYGLLRYTDQLSQESDARMDQLQIRFNYHGNWSQRDDANACLTPINLDTGPSIGVHNNRNVIEVNLFVIAGVLKAYFLFDQQIFDQIQVAEWANHFKEQLHAIATYLEITPFSNFTTYDFPLLEVPQADLDRIANQQNINEVLPLSSLQKGMLYHSLREPTSGAYIVQHLIHLVGEFNEKVFQEAWQNILLENEALRACFLWDGFTEPVQLIMKSVSLPFFWVDEKRLLPDILTEDRAHSFDLSKSPLIRLTLWYEDEKLYLLWSQHHILSDGWSVPLILNSFLKHYDALMQKGASTVLMAQQTLPLHDYFAWLKNADIEAAKTFWTGLLGDVTQPTYLANAVLSSDVLETGSDNPYAIQELWLDKNVYQVLQTTAQKNGITLNTIFQVAWAYVLAGFTHHDDIIFGMTVSGRTFPLEGIEKTVGLFINTLVVRILVDDAYLLSILKSTQKIIASINDYSYIALPEIQRCSAFSQYSLGRHGLFDTLFVFENYPIDASIRSHEHTLSIEECKGIEKTEYPLTVAVIPGVQCKLRISYQTKKFSDSSVKAILVCLQNVLTEFSNRDLQGKLLDVPFFWDKQRECGSFEQVSFSCGEKHDLKDPLHHLIEQQVQQNMNRTAIQTDEKLITYAELNQQANVLANHLIMQGVSPGTVVATYLTRSYELVVSLLAIWKVGAIYLPLDMDLPVSRLQFMLDDSSAVLLITAQDQMHSFSLPQINIKHLTEFFIVNNLLPDPKIPVSLNQGAYLMYTSGTTGQPKGVMNTHRGILNRLLWSQEIYSFGCNDSLLQIAAIGFDISVWEMILPILAGGVLVIAKPDGHKDIDYLVTRLVQTEITFFHIVPSLLRLLLSDIGIKKLPKLRGVLTGGEAVSPSLRSDFKDIVGCDLFVAYGPTEAAISVTHLNCQNDDYPGRVMIGSPIWNTQILILDQYQHVLPAGVIGEICIAGESLALGYMNKPHLSAQQFCDHPLFNDAGKKIYKTGDLGRLMPNGSIEFLGRIDHQIKINGNRVEPEEVASVIKKQIGIREAIVLSKQYQGKIILVAYIVADLENSILQITNALQESLPVYMQPKFIVPLDKIPLTLNGKVDRLALESIPLQEKSKTDSETKPTTTEEFLLLETWTTLFPETKRISLDDNFFALGGDSITSIKLVSLARRQGLEVQIQQVFEYPTIRILAKHVSLSETTLPKNQSEDWLESNQLSPIQYRFFETGYADPDYFNQCRWIDFAFKDSEPFSDAQKRKLVLSLIEYYDVFRFFLKKQQDGVYEKKWISGTAVDISQFVYSEQISLETYRAGDFSEIANKYHRKISIDHNLLCQFIFISSNESNHQGLLLIIHHLLIDEVSWHFLQEEVKRLATGVKGLSSRVTVNRIPSAPISYRVWINFLSDYSRNHKNINPYWLKENSEKFISLITHFQRSPQAKEFSMCRVNYCLEKKDTELLLLSQKNKIGFSVEQILLFAFVDSYSSWLDYQHFCIDIEKHGRDHFTNHFNITDAVGWFTSIYPMRISWPSEESLLEKLKHFKQLWKEVPQETLEYGVMRYLGGKADDMLPNSPVTFNYLGHVDPPSHIRLGQAVSHQNVPNGLLAECQWVNQDFYWSLKCDRKLYSVEALNQLMQRIQDAIHNICSFVLQMQKPIFVRADFPLSGLKQDQLDQLLAQYSEIESIYPLSPMQSGFLFSSLYHQESSAYFVHSQMKLEGRLDPSALERAWVRTLQRHPILRTGFICENIDHPLQFVIKEAKLPWHFLDWSKKNDLNFLESLKSLMHNDRNIPFHFQSPPLLRIHLICRGNDHHHLLISQHHILLDGWSLPLVIGDMLKFYAAEVLREEPILEERLAYEKYIAWLVKTDRQQAIHYWKRVMSTCQPSYISYAHTLCKKESGYATYEYNLDLEHSKALVEFSKRVGVTLNNVMQSIWAILLARYTQQKNIVFGVTLSGRSVPVEGIEQVVGLLINTLPLTVEFFEGMSILELIHHVQANMVNLQLHSSVSLAEVQALSPQGISNTAQHLFDSLFVFENFNTSSASELSYGGVVFKNLPMSVETEYPLTIAVTPHEQLRFQINYQTEHFSEVNIASIVDQIAMISSQVIKDASAPISSVNLLSVSGAQNLVPVQEGQIIPIGAEHLLDRFLAQVIRTPDAIAVQELEQQMSYAELNVWSDHVASQLHEAMQSITPTANPLIAIALPRSSSFIAAIWGVLKLGYAYLPLDLSNPHERLKRILDEASPALVLTESNLRNRFSIPICLMQEKEMSANNPCFSHYRKGKIAYVIYTSGSTGKPKGVVINERGLVNYLEWAMSYYPKQGSGAILHSSLAFDMTVTSLFLPLLTGQTIYLVPEIYGAEALIEGMRRTLAPFSFIKLTPSHFRMLRQYFSIEEIASKAHAYILGGEQLIGEDLIDFIPYVHSHGLMLVNEYGPTESTVACSAYALKNDFSYSIVPIGAPIHNTQLYIVDDALRILPFGYQGELCIVGEGLANEYLNNPGATQESFVELMLPGKGLKRAYRTGDLVHYDSSGNLIFRQRMDKQQKIRGYRIDLTEVENALLSHGDTKAVVVDICPDAMQQAQLVAYVIPDLFEPSETELKNYLVNRLPQYMIPSMIRIVSDFPLNQNGKIDKQVLRLQLTEAKDQNLKIAPLETDVERQLATIWSELLGQPFDNALTNFFSVGGHSLLATQLMGRIRQHFKIDFSIRGIFEHACLRDLAKEIERCQESQPVALAKIEKQKYEELIPLSSPQQRLWVLENILPVGGLYNIVVSYRFAGQLSKHALEKSFNALLLRHEILRTTFVRINNIPFQRIHQAQLCQIMWIDGSLETAKDCIQREMAYRYDLSIEQLMRVHVVCCSAQENILIINLHHIVTDGWSMPIFFRELSIFYNAYCNQADSSLKPLAIQYADFSIWQRNWLQSEAKNIQLQYWSDYLHNAEMSLELPVDRPREKIVNYEGAFHHFFLSEEETLQLQNLCNQHEITLFMLLISAFYRFLSVYAQQQDILIGTPIAGRNQVELEALIGLFVNTLPIRFNLSSTLSIRDFFTHIKKNILSAYQHQDLPFETLLEQLKITRDIDKNAIFQVMFVLQNAGDSHLNLEGLAAEPVTGQYRLSRFDLTLVAEKVGNRLKLSFNYATHLFDLATIVRWSAAYRALLSELSQVEFLNEATCMSAAEKNLLLKFSKGPSVDFPVNFALSDLFKKQVANTPHAIAIKDVLRHLTYIELDHLSNGIAHTLLSVGVSPGERVGLGVARNHHIVAGILAIHKIGCAYVPLDPMNPSKRLEYLLSDSGVQHVLVSESTKEKFPQSVSLLVEEITSTPIPVSIVTKATDTAYVIYTSGSTGTPKGVEVSHASVVNCLYGTAMRIGLTSDDYFIAIASFSFDISVFDYYMPLLLGASIFIADEVAQKTPKSLINLILQHNITCINVTPTMLNMLFQENSNLCVFDQKNIKVISVGEKLTSFIVEAISKRASLFNAYGPTEATIYATASEKITSPQQINIGRPLPNYEVSVVGRDMKSLPIGVAGELIIRGYGLAKGYLNRPDLTKMAFSELGYRTGDYVTFLPSGELNYLRRIDDQIKYHGHRIEYAEIEMQFVKLKGIQRCAVKLCGEGAAATLVAYVVADHSLEKSELINLLDQCSQQLPAYMVPSELFQVSEIPTTVSGKIDRKQLTDPQMLRGKTIDAHHVSQSRLTKEEQRIYDCWKLVLNREDIGVDDNFFQVGGNSLLIIQLYAILVEKLNYQGVVLDLFQYPTIRQFLRHSQGQRENKSDIEAEVLKQKSINRKVFLNRRRAQHATGEKRIVDE